MNETKTTTNQDNNEHKTMFSQMSFEADNMTSCAYISSTVSRRRMSRARFLSTKISALLPRLLYCEDIEEPYAPVDRIAEK